MVTYWCFNGMSGWIAVLHLCSLSLSLSVTCPGEVFHNIGKEDHRHPTTPLAPRNSPTGLPPLNSASLTAVPATHLPSMGSQPFPKTIAPTPGFMDAHPGLCLSAAEPPSIPGDGPVSAPPSICRSVSHTVPFTCKWYSFNIFVTKRKNYNYVLKFCIYLKSNTGYGKGFLVLLSLLRPEPWMECWTLGWKLIKYFWFEVVQNIDKWKLNVKLHVTGSTL